MCVALLVLQVAVTWNQGLKAMLLEDTSLTSDGFVSFVRLADSYVYFTYPSTH